MLVRLSPCNWCVKKRSGNFADNSGGAIYLSQHQTLWNQRTQVYRLSIKYTFPAVSTSTFSFNGAPLLWTAGTCSRAAIVAVPYCAISCYSSDDTCCIYLTYTLVVHISKVYIAATSIVIPTAALNLALVAGPPSPQMRPNRQHLLLC